MNGPRMLISNSSLGPDVSPLEVLVESIDSNVLHLKIGAPGRWEVPKDDLFINTAFGASQMPSGAFQQYLPCAAHMPDDHAVPGLMSIHRTRCSGHLMGNTQVVAGCQIGFWNFAGRKPGKPIYSVRYSTAPFGFAVDRVSANASAPPIFTTNSFPIIFKVSSSAFHMMS